MQGVRLAAFLGERSRTGANTSRAAIVTQSGTEQTMNGKPSRGKRVCRD
jgi:hypothetical protein